jgi:threonine/homoserine/homoserine lactone efflux protein
VNTEFWMTALVVCVTPGTGALFTVAAGLSDGARASIVAAVGCTLGTVPHIVAAVSGMALLISTSPVALTVLKWAGVVYLLWMSWSTLRSSTSVLTIDGNPAPRSALRTVVVAIGINVLNPKLTLFFFAFLPQFVPAGHHAFTRMCVLSGAFMALTFVVFMVYGLTAAALRGAIVTRPRVFTWIRRVLALSFVALSARLALAA